MLLTFIRIAMDQTTELWILGLLVAAIAWLYIDRDRSNKRMNQMETNTALMTHKMDTVLNEVKNTNTRLDLFLKAEIDTFKDALLNKNHS